MSGEKGLGPLPRVVNTALGDTVGAIAKYQIRYERHGNTDKPGGLE